MYLYIIITFNIAFIILCTTLQAKNSKVTLSCWNKGFIVVVVIVTIVPIIIINIIIIIIIIIIRLHSLNSSIIFTNSNGGETSLSLVRVVSAESSSSPPSRQSVHEWRIRKFCLGMEAPRSHLQEDGSKYCSWMCVGVPERWNLPKFKFCSFNWHLRI